MIQRPGGCVAPAELGKKVDSDPQLQANLESVLEERTAGDPDDDRVRFTEMTPPQIFAAVTEIGTPVSPDIVRNWLEDQGLALRQMEKGSSLRWQEPKALQTLLLRAIKTKGFVMATKKCWQ